MAGVNWERKGERSEEAHGNDHEAGREEDILELGSGEGVVLGHELQIVRKVGRIGSLRFHVALGSISLAFGFECQRKFESATGYLRLAEVAELGLYIAEVVQELLLWDLQAIVVEHEGCRA